MEIEIEMFSNWTVNNLERAVIASGYPMLITIPPPSEPTERDWARADRLARHPANSGHCNFLKGINVFVDVTAGGNWWAQAQRYQHFTLVSSQSKMHRGLQFDLGQRMPDVDPRIIALARQLQTDCIEGRCTLDRFLNSLPSGLQLTCAVSTNYLQLRTMHQQRRHHPLRGWRLFVEWVEQLPKSGWITNAQETNEEKEEKKIHTP